MGNPRERRTCVRFEVPDAMAQFRRKGFLEWRASFSEELPVVNISKGGLAFVCPSKMRKGKKMLVRLIVPQETSVDILGEVRWQSQSEFFPRYLTGIQFAPYGKKRGGNAVDVLRFLEKLEDRYYNQPFGIPVAPLFAETKPASAPDLNSIF
ncbi:hypothetical protein D3OALGA1CA_2763 [Olavius algarvensis associated proteobacterium Delta 3]|nr:hypothetical protein D3OALGB2SA_781 [Olavius algarvensis associated proteobacterium Delta 3]CAB5123906.1 hypothetical protein D3OALGA1CA_2763 [Olavius algarvensis associated proteobacterium Delta 3]